MIGKFRPKLVFSAKEALLNLSNYSVVFVDRENQFAEIDRETGGVLLPEADIAGTDPAYIMFTSGSTGFPKGSVMSHANLLNFIVCAREEFQINSEDVFTNLNPLYFDNS